MLKLPFNFAKKVGQTSSKATYDIGFLGGFGDIWIESFNLSSGSHVTLVLACTKPSITSDTVRHVTGTGSGLLGEIPRVVVQKSALL